MFWTAETCASGDDISFSDTNQPWKKYIYIVTNTQIKASWRLNCYRICLRNYCFWFNHFFQSMLSFVNIKFKIVLLLIRKVSSIFGNINGNVRSISKTKFRIFSSIYFWDGCISSYETNCKLSTIAFRNSSLQINCRRAVQTYFLPYPTTRLIPDKPADHFIKRVPPTHSLFKSSLIFSSEYDWGLLHKRTSFF